MANRQLILKDLKTISPSWASNIAKQFRLHAGNEDVLKLSLLQARHTNLMNFEKDRILKLKEYPCCVVGEAFCFPEGRFGSNENPQRFYANCRVCGRLSGRIFATLSNNNFTGFWSYLEDFTIHFKKSHKQRYHKKLLQLYKIKLEQKVTQLENKLK